MPESNTFGRAAGGFTPTPFPHMRLAVLAVPGRGDQPRRGEAAKPRRERSRTRLPRACGRSDRGTRLDLGEMGASVGPGEHALHGGSTCRLLTGPDGGIQVVRW